MYIKERGFRTGNKENTFSVKYFKDVPIIYVQLDAEHLPEGYYK